MTTTVVVISAIIITAIAAEGKFNTEPVNATTFSMATPSNTNKIVTVNIAVSP